MISLSLDVAHHSFRRSRYVVYNLYYRACIYVKPIIFDTKKSVYKELNALLNYAVRMEYIPKNPLPTVGNFKDAYAVKKDMDFYTADEFKQFIAAARIRAEQSSDSIHEWYYYVFFNIAFYMGMRKGEIYALKWTDIRDDVIYIRRSISQKLKGEDRETPPKTKASVRDIQIPIPLKKVLEEHRERCKHIKGYSDNWHICGGAQCVRDSTVTTRNELYANLAGLKHIRVHDFRHSHVSVLAHCGINIQEIARRLGQSDVKVTWNTYCHMYPKERETAVDVLNNL